MGARRSGQKGDKMTLPHPAASTPSPGRGGRARSVPASPGAFSRTDIGSLPAGQLIALLILHRSAQSALVALARQVVPHGSATPTMDDYLAIILAGFADMRGGLHLPPAGTCAAGTVMRMIEAG